MSTKAQLAKFKDTTVEFTGKQIILPEGMSFETAIVWLQRRRDEEEQEINIHETIPVLPLEGSLYFSKALKNLLGFFEVRPPKSFFDSPPTWVSLEVGYKQTEQVLWGMIEVPGVVGYLQTHYEVANGQVQFAITGQVKKKSQRLVQQIIAEVKRIAEEESIYKGKAIQLQFPDTSRRDFNPVLFQHKFLDTAKIKPEQLIFPKRVQQLVDDTLFTPLRYTAAVRAAKIPLKRGILLEGPFGTGKTLTQYVAAKHATDNGWTYIAVEETSRLAEAMHFAKKYQPAVVTAEDIDRADPDGDRSDEMNTILNTIDGASFKDTEIIVLLTTNHVEDITTAMLRPGRLDAVIPVRPPDAAAVERLIQLYAGTLLDPFEPLDEVGEVLAGQIPAVIREVVERSKLSAITRQQGMGAMVITQADLLASAAGMLEHLELLKERPEDDRSDREKAADILGGKIIQALSTFVDGDEPEIPTRADSPNRTLGELVDA